MIDPHRAEKLESVLSAARNLVWLWREQKIAGLSRAERNASIEGCREALTLAVAQIDPDLALAEDDRARRAAHQGENPLALSLLAERG